MAIQIENGVGNGNKAKVDSNNKLSVNSTSRSLQHVISDEFQQSYQVIGVSGTLSSATVTAMHIKNTSTIRNLVVTFIKHQLIDINATVPAVTEYFKVALGRTWASGGTAVVPVNVNTGSSNLAEVTVYNNSPVLAGTATEIDRWYTKAEGDMNTFSKEGALILAPGGTMELSYVGTGTAGICYTRLSFFMEDINSN